MINPEPAAEDDVHDKTSAPFDDLENSDASDDYWDSETATSDDEDDDKEDEYYYQGE